MRSQVALMDLPPEELAARVRQTAFNRKQAAMQHAFKALDVFIDNHGQDGRVRALRRELEARLTQLIEEKRSS